MELGEILIAVFTGVVALCTGLYCALTGWLAWETRQMRKVQTDPRVSIRVEADHTGHPGYELVIQNNGQGVAKNVRFEFEGDPTYFRNSWGHRSPPQINELPVIRDGLDYLERDQVYRFFLGSVSPEEYERAVEVPWIFRTQYENSYGKRLIDKHIVDFAQFRGVFFESNYMEQMAEHTKGIRNDLHRLTEGYARIQIVTQTREEHERRREEWRKAQENRISDVTEMPIADGDEQ